ncbi:MAG: DNA alkylation repair protein [Chloroflexi bacterium]|nr:MAG: DNA alkylation repair protein [Chloroflexota bacterium]MBL1196825.1 DNA alkylation repair protein [Chloroflexota bacterium]NOH14120.1 DNA alkylation repair protein [Chloroflexota bacterium]
MEAVAAKILAELKNLGDPKNIAEAQRVGGNMAKAYGVKVPHLRAIAKEHRKDHELALALWATDVHEARILASMVDDPAHVTEEQMETWVLDFNSWDLCDQCCGNLFDKTPYAYAKALEWSEREEEYVKRAGFAMMACLAWHDKKASNQDFEQFFPAIKREATDERNFVKKAVNWALRNIGKLNLELNAKAIKVAEDIDTIDDKTARWIAKDALRELRSEKIQARLEAKEEKMRQQ